MTPWTKEEMFALAQSGVAKVDLLGQRGTTLVTCDEVAAMAGVIAISGALPTPQEPNPELKSQRSKVQ